jgi:hypothetical protein
MLTNKDSSLMSAGSGSILTALASGMQLESAGHGLGSLHAVVVIVVIVFKGCFWLRLHILLCLVAFLCQRL